MISNLNTDEALLGLGGNLGDVAENLRSAIKLLNDDAGIELLEVSHLYKTPPWGITDQPWFLNCCVRIRCTLDPHKLLKTCLDTEKRLKRVRNQRWGPRTIDIDVLAFGAFILKTEVLTVPHPRMFERAFVLTPLADIAGEVVIEGTSVADWARAVPDERMERVGTDLDWWKLSPVV